MAEYHVGLLGALIDKLNSLPGIGPRTAQRLAYHLLHMPDPQLEALLKTVWDAHHNLRECPVCCNLTDQDLCAMCADSQRDQTAICVVEEPKDVTVLERSGEFGGLYHVLHGRLSPLNGVGPDDLRVKELLARVTPEVKEVILATNATTESEATALYVAKLLKPLGVLVTRLGCGLPSGGELEYADEYTLKMALEGRTKL